MQPLGDSEVLLSVFERKFEKVSYEIKKTPAHCRASRLLFCLSHFHIVFKIKLFVKHCIVILLLWGVTWDHIMNLLPHTTVNHKCDVFIRCNLFISSLLYTSLLFFL